MNLSRILRDRTEPQLFSSFNKNLSCLKEPWNRSEGLTLWLEELVPADSRGLEESSEDSEELDQAVPFSITSWCRRRF